MLRAGLIEKSGVVEDWYCDDCALGHGANIVFDQGRYGYFCPELGFVPLKRDLLVAVSAHAERLVSCLADALSVSNRKTSPIRGQTWRIGKLKSEHGDLSLYYHPSLVSADDLLHLQNALIDEIGTRFRLILTATGTLPVEGCRVMLLSDFVELGSDGTFQLTTDPWDLAGVEMKKSTGRPNQFRAPVQRLARQRIANGEAHGALKTEAKAILALLREEDTEAVPSLTTAKNYLSKVREG